MIMLTRTFGMVKLLFCCTVAPRFNKAEIRQLHLCSLHESMPVVASETERNGKGSSGHRNYDVLGTTTQRNISL
jgi:hypothetical protein